MTYFFYSWWGKSSLAGFQLVLGGWSAALPDQPDHLKKWPKPA